jgi:hypothetical protein
VKSYVIKNTVNGITKINNNTFNAAQVWRMTEFIIHIKTTEKVLKARL